MFSFPSRVENQFSYESTKLLYSHECTLYINDRIVKYIDNLTIFFLRNFKRPTHAGYLRYTYTTL